MAYDENYLNPYEGGSSLVFNGVDLGKECNMFVLGKGAFGAPSRDVTQIHVPGRNGDILIDNGGWNNVDVTYSSCCILSNFRENVAKLKEYLLANPGYHELTDPYNPDEVRYAEFRGPFTPEAFTPKSNNAGMFDLTFNCKPQRFLRESVVPRNYVLCPYERIESTVDSNDYAYIVDNMVPSNNYKGSTFTFYFNTEEQIKVSNGYFYKIGYDGRRTTVPYDGETLFENGIVSIPLIGKDGTKYSGFKGEIHAGKSADFRLDTDNVKYRKSFPIYYYYKDGDSICFPFNNKTQFDAYPIIYGRSGGTISCGGNSVKVSTNSFFIDGTNKIAIGEGGVYSGFNGNFPIIPGGIKSVLKITGYENIGGVVNNNIQTAIPGCPDTEYFQITPMFYRI